MKLKLFAFVAWMGTEENTPRVSACTLDTETGDTIFDTVCMDSSLIFPLKTDYQNKALMSYFAMTRRLY